MQGVAETTLLVAALIASNASAASPGWPDRVRVALDHGVYWDLWEREANRQCPSHHLKWVGMSDDAADMVGGFDGILTRPMSLRVEKIADYARLCPREWNGGFGFTCYLAVHARAYQRLGLLHRFVAFSCKHWSDDAEGSPSGSVQPPIRPPA
jgi:hypothetical protein